VSGFRVINPSILTLIQDIGRFSYANIGITQSGAMDEFAYFLANKLLDNSLNKAAIEICFASLKLISLGQTTISITGADISLHINGVYKKPWATYKIKKDDILEFRKLKDGLRAYLGVKNGFKFKKEFGSCSTTIKEKLGGINGEAIKKDDILPFENCNIFYTKRLKKRYIPRYSNLLTLRVFLSYQKNYFSKDNQVKFFSSEFTLTNDMDRMGIKLKGETIISSKNGIISEGIAFGSIQVPNPKELIILLKDRQTIGGYPKIGTVLSIDCFKLAQAKPYTKIKFQQIDLNEATQTTKQFYINLFF
jgi:biotin-dependent carboxylase-like uncharacterized protein